MTWTDDSGTTGTRAIDLWGPMRPYTHVCSDGASRLDLFFDNSHPGLDAQNDVWHCYMQGGTFYTSAGVKIADIAVPGDFPIAISYTTPVFDSAAQNANAWVYDIVNIGGVPVGAFVAYSGNNRQDHRYYQARWSGGAWVCREIIGGGGPLIPGEPYYSGAIVTDPQDANTVYLSPKDASDWFQIWRYRTTDGGVTWTGVQLTSGTEHHLRPVVPTGSGPAGRRDHDAGRMAFDLIASIEVARGDTVRPLE